MYYREHPQQQLAVCFTADKTHAAVVTRLAEHMQQPSTAAYTLTNDDQCHFTLAGTLFLTLAGTHIRIHHLSDSLTTSRPTI